MTTTTSSRAAVVDSEPKLFQLGASLFEGTHDEAASLSSISSAKETPATFPANEDEHPSQQQLQGETEEPSSVGGNAEEDKSKSPRSDHEGTGAGGEHGSLDSRTRANRQRRRIAGGVISLPTPPKTLVSMKSASSLSNAFRELSSTAASAVVGANDRLDDDGHPTAELEYDHEHKQGHDETPITTGGKATTAVAVKEAEGGQSDSDDDEATRTKNGDLVTEAMMADVEADVTIGEAHSLLKSPPVVADGSAQEDDDTEGAK